ncbi:hypothetical protein D3C71_1892530 [compost metagenome]
MKAARMCSALSSAWPRMYSSSGTRTAASSGWLVRRVAVLLMVLSPGKSLGNRWEICRRTMNTILKGAHTGQYGALWQVCEAMVVCAGAAISAIAVISA